MSELKETIFIRFARLWAASVDDNEFMFASPPISLEPPKWVILHIEGFWERHEPWFLFYRVWKGTSWETVQFGTYESPILAMFAARKADKEEERMLEELDEWCREQEELRARGEKR